MTWATRRQVIYFLIAFGVVFVFLGVPFFMVYYHKPTCFDGQQNGGEQGVDCGGSCTRLCKATEISPVPAWQQSFEVLPGIYNAVAYVQNPNIDAQAFAVPYTFSFTDSTGKVIGERKGTTYIPPGKNFVVFESGVTLPGAQGQIHTSFEFDTNFTWIVAASSTPQLLIKDQRVSDITTAPVVTADVINSALTDLGRINVTALVYDTEGNAVAASRTYLDRLPRQSQSRVVFTWPRPFTGQVTSCQQPTDIVLDIDRSGSMSSDGKNPPEPMTSVKNAALSFVENVRKNDKIGVVSFASDASSPIDSFLTLDRDLSRDSIRSIVIGADGLQYTNIYAALEASLGELSGNRHRPDAKQAIVLLTDGKPTFPEKKGDKNYPADRALAIAHEAQSQGIEIFTIGLGKDIDDDFLKSISGFTERYYKAPTKDDLETVYKNISSALCKVGPAKVEIIPDIIPAVQSRAF